MPSSDGKRGKPFRDHRQVVEGIIYRYRTGIAWRDLPAASSGRGRRCGSGTGAWPGTAPGTRCTPRCSAEADAAGKLGWQVSVDSTVNRAHQHGTNLTRAEHGTGGIVELQESAGRAG